MKFSRFIFPGLLFLLILGCSKEEISNQSRFIYKDNFEDSITYPKWKFSPQLYWSGFKEYNGTRVLFIYVMGNSNVDYGTAIRDFSNLSGLKAYSLTANISGQGKMFLKQFRNGVIIRKIGLLSEGYIASTYYCLRDTFDLINSDTLQIELSKKFIPGPIGLSGSQECYFDNIELIEN